MISRCGVCRVIEHSHPTERRVKHDEGCQMRATVSLVAAVMLVSSMAFAGTASSPAPPMIPTPGSKVDGSHSTRV
jgi:hypothetical protein